MNLPLIILGAGGHARVLLEALRGAGREVKGIMTPEKELWGKDIYGALVIGDDDCINNYDQDEINVVNGIGSVGDPSIRIKTYTNIKEKGFSFATVVHPSAIISRDVVLSEGSQVMAGAVIQPGCFIGENVIVNTGAILDHDCRVGSHVHIAPGVVLSGGVVVGAKTHIGTGACVIQGVVIGESVLVFAGAVIVRDIPNGSRVRGVNVLPAKQKNI